MLVYTRVHVLIFKYYFTQPISVDWVNKILRVYINQHIHLNNIIHTYIYTHSYIYIRNYII